MEFLPNDLNYPFDFRRLSQIIFDKNFLLLEGRFHTSPDAEDILVLNLITRRPFWMRGRTLVTQMKEKAAGQVDFGGLGVNHSEATHMYVESDGLLIGYKIQMENEFSAVSLG